MAILPSTDIYFSTFSAEKKVLSCHASQKVKLGRLDGDAVAFFFRLFPAKSECETGTSLTSRPYALSENGFR